MSKAWLPADFKVPEGLDTPNFKLRPLLITDVDADYDAVITSFDDIKTTFGEASCWVRSGITLEQNLIDLGWHHKEFQTRASFAYKVLSPDEDQYLGCVYIYPPQGGFDAAAYCWMRSSHKHMDARLYQTFRDWLAKDWPFKMVAFPGRNPDWPTWAKLEAM